MNREIWEDVERAYRDQVLPELERAFVKHPGGWNSIMRGTCIVAEEAGEAIRAVVDLTRPGNEGGKFADDYEALRKEIVQTAAMALRWLATFGTQK